MKLLTYTVHLSGSEADTGGWCVDMAQLASRTTDREVAVWAGFFGVPEGTYTFSVRVRGVADFQAWLPTLEGNAEYQKMVAAAVAMTAAPAEAQIANVLHGQLGEAPPPVGTIAVTTQAIIANGKYERAMGWSIDMTQHVEKITGMPAMFLASEYGAFGEVAWIQAFPDGEAVDAATEAMNSDPDYLAKLGEAGDLFVPASGQRALILRIG